MKVYIVTAGDYSDYSVIGAFSSREEARKYIDKFSKVNRQINKYDEDILELDVDALNKKEQFVVVSYAINAHSEDRAIYIHEYSVSDKKGQEKEYVTKQGGKCFVFYISCNHRVFNNETQAEINKHLLKIAQDKYAKFKAQKR